MLHTLTRTLAAALAVVALAAPSALARPGGPASADAARDAKPPVYWSYEYEAPIPPAAQPARTVETVASDDGTPWVLIAGPAGACLLVGGLAAMATRRRFRPST